jgi:hypothetical protein
MGTIKYNAVNGLEMNKTVSTRTIMLWRGPFPFSTQQSLAIPTTGKDADLNRGFPPELPLRQAMPLHVVGVFLCSESWFNKPKTEEACGRLPPVPM